MHKRLLKEFFKGLYRALFEVNGGVVQQGLFNRLL